jgi:hypothetical protein
MTTLEIEIDQTLSPIVESDRIVIICGGKALLVARHLASRINGPIRAPHHTISASGLMSELALSAGGSLILDEADEFRRFDLAPMLSTWRMMDERFRPRLILTIRDSIPTDRLQIVFPTFDRMVQMGRETL